MDNANSLATALISNDIAVDTMVPALLWPALGSEKGINPMSTSCDLYLAPALNERIRKGPGRIRTIGARSPASSTWANPCTPCAGTCSTPTKA